MLPQLLHVGHEVISGIVMQLAKRHRPAAAALVEDHNAIELGVEEPAMDRCRAGAWATVQEHHRQAFWVAALLPIDRVPRIYRQHAAGVG